MEYEIDTEIWMLDEPPMLRDLARARPLHRQRGLIIPEEDLTGDEPSPQMA